MSLGRSKRAVAALGLLAIVAAGCGGDDSESSTASSGGASSEASSGGGTSDAGQFVIGRILPETGPLAFLGPPMIEGVNLAIKDINEAGGVFGKDVKLVAGDEGSDEAATKDAASRLLNQGAKAIIGPASSGKVQSIIQQLSDGKIPECSGSATSPTLSTQANANFFVRTVPPDEAVAPIIADTVIEDGHTKVAIVARSDDYGKALGDLVAAGLTASGASVVATVPYDPAATTFDAEVGQVIAAAPDAVVLVAFDEGGKVVAGLLEKGIKPAQIYGSDGVFGPTFPATVDPSNKNVIDGLKVIGAAGNKAFNDRIADATDNNFIYGGQTYDCAILLALGAETVGNANDGAAIVAAAIAASKGGEKCESFKDCKELIADGKDIDYDGAGGPLALDDNGDPTQATYAIGQFTAGELTIVDSKDTEVK